MKLFEWEEHKTVNLRHLTHSFWVGSTTDY